MAIPWAKHCHKFNQKILWDDIKLKCQRDDAYLAVGLKTVA
jgi:hypothetical protein